MRQQCALLSVNRSTLYYKQQSVALNDAIVINEIRDIWLCCPFYGYRRMTQALRERGHDINRKRVQRLMREGGIHALYAKPRTSIKDKAHAIYPYLLKELKIDRVNQAWMVDITYLRHGSGFMYLVAIIDVYSRYVVGWSLSNTLDTQSCVDALTQALIIGQPEILNSDQGCQFTSGLWIDTVKQAGIQVSMTGRGRCLDNVYIERFWRSLKQEEFYLNEYVDVPALKQAIQHYIEFYNNRRYHQALAYKKPAEIYFGGIKRLEQNSSGNDDRLTPQLQQSTLLTANEA